MKNSYFKNLLKILLLGAVILILIYVGTALEIYLVSKQTANINADAAIVLGAAIYKDKPSPVFRERINHAIELLKSQKIKYIIFTGGFGENEKFSEAAVAKNYALLQGVPSEQLFIEEKSRTTFQNLYFAREIAERNKFKDILIVSDPLHMKRAMILAQEVGFQRISSSPTQTSRIINFSNQLEFLCSETNQLLMLQARGIIWEHGNPAE